MKSIEIITPQNVPLEYPLASFQLRTIAFIIDAIIMAILVFLTFLSMSIFGSSPRSEKLLFLSLVIPIILFYALVCELLTHGYSPGKKIMKLRIIKITGEPLQISDLLIRWAFRWIDIWGSLGSVAAFQISSSNRGQRVGDLLADTTVINEGNAYQVKLNDLLELNKTTDEAVVYPGVIHLSEKEMLWVRYTLLRYKRIPNESHRALVHILAQQLAEKTKSKIPPGKPVLYLEQLIRDFIRITRN
jgi:uncharacterized RDD family membrane protein YckC